MQVNFKKIKKLQISYISSVLLVLTVIVLQWSGISETNALYGNTGMFRRQNETMPVEEVKKWMAEERNTSRRGMQHSSGRNHRSLPRNDPFDAFVAEQTRVGLNWGPL